MTEPLATTPVPLPPRGRWLRAALRRSLFAAAVFATLVALFYAEENWRGRHQWERFRAEWEAQGVKFELAAVMSPPIPDDQNVAMHPLFKPVFDYTLDDGGACVWRDTNAMKRLNSLTAHPEELRQAAKADLPMPGNSGVQNRTNGLVLTQLEDWQRFYRLDTNFALASVARSPAEDVLRYLERHDATLALLDEALARSQCRFPIRVSEMPPGQFILPHLANLSRMNSLLSLRAAANLEAGRAKEALHDVERAWRLCETLEDEPFVICQLVQIAMQARLLGAIAHGAARHRWEDRHLSRLEELLRPVNKLAGWQRTVRTEAAHMAEQMARFRQDRPADGKALFRMVQLLDGGERRKPNTATKLLVARYAPAGWFHQSQVRELAVLLASLEPTFILPGQRRVSWQSMPVDPPKLWFDQWWPLSMVDGGFTRSAAKCARLQTNFDHARIAVALERHWLRHRAYPEKLDSLVPEFLDRIPHDIFDGQPMRYRREGEQGFVLWSVGFDGRDENAAPLYFKGSGSVGEELGDLVWRYPQSP